MTGASMRMERRSPSPCAMATDTAPRRGRGSFSAHSIASTPSGRSRRGRGRRSRAGRSRRYRSTWKSGSRPPRYSWTSVKVGLLTSPASTPSPSASPRHERGLPRPEVAGQQDDRPGARASRASSPADGGGFLLRSGRGRDESIVLLDDLAAGGELEDGVAEVAGDVGRRHRHLALRRPPRDRRPCRAGRRRACTRPRRRAAAPARRRSSR